MTAAVSNLLKRCYLDERLSGKSDSDGQGCFNFNVASTAMFFFGVQIDLTKFNISVDLQVSSGPQYIVDSNRKRKLQSGSGFRQ